MKENYILLLNKFNNIKKLGWIKSKRGGITGSGYTFETLLGKNEDSFFLPDFNGIEIKTINEKSKYNMTLFCANPDGDYLFPMQKVYKRLAYPSKKDPNINVLNVEANCINYTKIGYYKKIKLEIDKNKRKIYLIGIRDNKNLNLYVSWSFDLIEERLNLKLKYMALVITKNKKINNEYYFLYDRIIFYKLKSFDKFIELMENGVISIKIQIEAYYDSEKYGQMKNKGTAFAIKRNYIDSLFDKIDT